MYHFVLVNLFNFTILLEEQSCPRKPTLQSSHTPVLSSHNPFSQLGEQAGMKKKNLKSQILNLHLSRNGQ